MLFIPVKCRWIVAGLMVHGLAFAEPVDEESEADSETPAPVTETATSEDLDAILSKLDQLYRSDSSYAEMTMQIVTPHWERTLDMRAWSEGMGKTFIRILAPRKERGVGTLRIDTEMWNYLPKTNKIIKIPPSMMMSSWMGSDFTNDDLVREYTFIEDYNFELAEVSDAEPEQIPIACYPKEGRPIIWGKILLAVRKEDHLPGSVKFNMKSE